jgi:AraC family transcriptional regulator, alkane utilization regulator
VAAVADAVGYESEVAFPRAFKKQVGQAPAAWRKGSSSAPEFRQMWVSYASEKRR